MIRLLTFIFGPVVTEITEMRKELRGLNEKISFRVKFGDFFHVARNTGFVLVPAILSGFIFLLLAQGRDTLLMVIEKMDTGDFRQFLFFLIAIVIWSMSSELSVRYAIAIADNSGKSLRDSRVYWRKTAQRLLAGLSLFGPAIMIIIALIFCYRSATYMPTRVKLQNFGIFLASLLAILRALSYLYFHRYPRNANEPARTPLGARSLPRSEYDWVNRLYGIYNEFVYAILKPTNFKGQYRRAMQGFANHLIHSSEATRAEFPQNRDVMDIRRIVPADFEVINKDFVNTERGDSYKWRYRIPTSYFKILHCQLAVMAAVSIILVLVFAFLPADSRLFGIIGAPALICFAFASYSGIYSGLLFIDFGLFRRNFFQVRWLLFAWLLVVSCINKDHPVNMNKYPNGPRNTLTGQFNTWFANYKHQQDSIYPGTQKYPVVFVCAEGGALRTGAYTSIFLTRLQQDLQLQGIDFNRSVFLMSGVSGGALGLAYYNARAFRTNNTVSANDPEIKKAVKFYQYDSLSPIVGKMFFGEFVNLFLPWHIKRFDRSIALEESWKQAYQTAAPGENNRFSENFGDGRADALHPVLVINTSEIESGYQCWISNVKPDSILYQGKRDLLDHKVNQISYSTAVDFSTRFPLFSPGAEIDTIGGRFHYLDGGYVENTGAGSAFEILSLLDRKVPAFRQVVPIVIYLRFSNNDNTQARNIHFANELVEIIAGIYNTRVGRSFTAIAQVNQFVKSHGGIIIDEPLSKNDRDVPMNWALSKQSVNNLMGDINDKMNDRTGAGIKTKLFQKGLHYLPVKK